jgi:hypothetical protein
LDEGQATLSAVGLGFVVALIVIVAAFFQDPLVAVVRWAARRLVHVLVPVVGGLSDAVGAGGRRAAGAAVGAPGRIARAVATLAGAGREPTPRRRHAPIAPARAGGRAAAGSGDAGRAARPLPADEGGPAAEPEERRPAEERRRHATPRERIGQRRLYMPTSSLHMEEVAREFLRPRGGSVPVDSLVRHLDQRFGAARGAVVLEVLRRRGLVRVSRDPGAPTRMIAALVDEPVESSDDE